MAVGKVSITYMLRHSGEVVASAEQRDDVVHRRDGEDVVLVACSRQDALRESLDTATRLVESLFADRRVRRQVLEHLGSAVPWTAWLPDHDRAEFVEAFAAAVLRSGETGVFDPLDALL